MEFPLLVRKATWILAIGLWAVSSTTISAQDLQQERPSLRGLKALGIRVEKLDPVLVRNGVSESDIRKDAELKLRLAGISVLTIAETARRPGGPYLYIRITSTSNSSVGMTANGIDVAIIQDVALVRDPTIALPATTWQVGSTTLGGTRYSNEMRDYIKDHLDTFINAWLSVNPK